MPERRWVANCSTMFRELSLLDRPAAACAAGFEVIELWWPFAEPVPSDREVDALVGAIADSGARLGGLNFWAGDLAGPDCGVLSLPGRAHELAANVEVAIDIGERLGVPLFNALYGNRDDTTTPGAQLETATQSLSIAAAAAARIGATVLIEPISGPKPYPLRTAADAMAVVDRMRALGVANVGLLCDVFHLAANGDDPVAAILRHGESIAHVQIADHPGRGEPGSGSLDLDGCLDALDQVGYDGSIGLEHVPLMTTEAGLDQLTSWLHTHSPSSSRSSA